MPRHHFPHACCKRFSELAMRFVDESANLDSRLNMIGALCEATDQEKLGPGVVAGIGVEIRDYLGRRCTVEHHFFDRTLTADNEADPRTVGELARIAAAGKE